MSIHIFLDIEALGRRPGCAITELGAVAFFPETGEILGEFHVSIEPQPPFFAELETLEWHKEKGTWSREGKEGQELHSIGSALALFGDWLEKTEEKLNALYRKILTFWSWGSTYDFPILDHAYEFSGVKKPWRYWQCRCARTVWHLVFGYIRHAPRPHSALEDAKMGMMDLMKAIATLSGKTHDS